MVIEAARVSKTYPAVGRGRRRREAHRALTDVDVQVHAGERVALLGPNGSGKTTLLRVLATMLSADSGQVRLLGVDVRGAGVDDPRLRAARARMGVVFQSPGLDPLLSIRENLTTQAALFGMSGERARERVRWAAGKLALEARLDDRVGALSGGLARRTDLARALLHRPELLLLDEPTTGLDLRARGEFLDTLDIIAAAAAAEAPSNGNTAPTPLTVLMTTHLMDEAERASRVLLMHEGKIVAQGAPSELRAALGPAVLRIHPGQKDVDRVAAKLAELGLSVRQEAGGRTGATEPSLVAQAGPGDGEHAEAMAQAATALTREGIGFVYGPPTLADVYLAHTGAALEALPPLAAQGAHG